ncbi:MAG TPA: sialate O-acetylesterase [Puia sp.]|nr:sialate O-acetylesterase [Puia sp.]
MKRIVLFFWACISTLIGSANVSLPKIFSSNMLLQRDKPVKVWGWADAGESITVAFNGQTLGTKAGKNGEWQVILAAMKYGGPFEMKITGKNDLQFTNVLIGDVWICSGQSNMEWLLRNTNDAAREIQGSQYPGIRLITVKESASFRPQKDIATSGWQECSPVTAGDFSAVAYFFGRKLNRDLNIPVGLISSSWGGTIIQAWTSWDVMGKDAQYKTVNLDDKEKESAAMKEKQDRYNAAMKNDVGDVEKWWDPASAVQGWKPVRLPQYWEQTEIGNVDGNIWFKKEFDLPPAMEGKSVSIGLGPVDDDETTWLNGKKIGGTQGYNVDRVYAVDPSLLQKGKNVLVVKVTDNGGGGGIYGNPGQLSVEGSGLKISLAGEWQYKPSTLSTQFGIADSGPNSFPSQLYNAMIAPLVPYAIKGVIWYQGESNILEAFKYRQLFPDMIMDWRKQWKDDFPFLWVQIASFFPQAPTPQPSYLAELREAQHRTLALPGTGEALTIDIGDANEIHPRNKQDVGYRLGLVAEHVTYGADSVFSGPQYVSATSDGNKMVLRFNSMGSGLMAKDKYGYLRGFSIAGDDQQFVWAKAWIEGDKIIVSSERIGKPVAVRYAWADNAGDANLYNKEGLPASPFRSDNWKGLTEK